MFVKDIWSRKNSWSRMVEWVLLRRYYLRYKMILLKRKNWLEISTHIVKRKHIYIVERKEIHSWKERHIWGDRYKRRYTSRVKGRNIQLRGERYIVEEREIHSWSEIHVWRERHKKRYTWIVKKRDMQLKKKTHAIEEIYTHSQEKRYTVDGKTRTIEGKNTMRRYIYTVEGEYTHSLKFVLKEADIYKIGWSKGVWFHALTVKIYRSFFSNINKFQASTNAERCKDTELQLRKTIFELNKSTLLSLAQGELKITLKNFFQI